jgi:hypothetical protein
VRVIDASRSATVVRDPDQFSIVSRLIAFLVALDGLRRSADTPGMRAIRQIALMTAMVAVFIGVAGFARLVPVDDCCQSKPVGDDCCAAACDHCLWCTPVVAVAISEAAMVGFSQPPGRLELTHFRDPVAPEPRGILHVPKAA